MERLQDFEDKVRSRAIATICEAAIAHPEVGSMCYAMWVSPFLHVFLMATL